MRRLITYELLRKSIFTCALFNVDEQLQLHVVNLMLAYIDISKETRFRIETGYYYVAQVGLEFIILLSQC